MRRPRWARLPRGWRRAVALRRLAAAVLVVVAVVLAVVGAAAPAVSGVPVLRARHDLAPGAAVGPDDVEVVARPPDAVPAGALRAVDDVVGRHLVGPVRPGEVLTDVRLVGPEAAREAVGMADAAGVPLRLADPAVAALVRAGALVDVVGGAGVGGGGGVVLARGARVLTVLPGEERSASPPLVLVALPGPEAARVAAATVGQDVTLTLR
ncbi:SAF domain-containing protein [Actinomycetospora sp. TBRC 11914]|uniref:SAF domain-containing protein n=1 Tax=Actinomycetospora sp. TBRC 11914 TaxID=2729387 RepID=UPI00145D3CD2|nr:SAF domain-containing protein [Actinomycetospora sp. TBRC 11914]NMO90853.1 flagellar biosynthesis protein FlgA [Actinomycetospora sp. TBRC 11914]